jgi:hypothetical protein
VAAERVALEHVVERGLEFLRRHLPRHERPLREIRRQQRLPHAPNRPPRSIAWIRSMTTANSTPDCRAISPSGSRWKPWSRSSETARIFALTGSWMLTETVAAAMRLILL